MNLNLLDLLNQIKKFTTQEKGNIFSLITYFLLAIILLTRYFGTSVSKTHPEYDIYILLLAFCICIFTRSRTRNIPRSKQKINIAIAQVNILNTSLEKRLDAEQKLSMSTEISNYIYSCLIHTKQELSMDNYLHFFRLPSRININYGNSEIVDKLKIDTLIRGMCRFDNDKFYINYKMTIRKRIHSTFFNTLVNDLNNYPEIEFHFSGKGNEEFDKFIHMVSYLSIIYKSLELMNKEEYKESETLLTHGLDCLQKLYDDDNQPSVQKGDEDVEKIEICMYYALAKNYFNRANHCLENFDYRNDANQKLNLCLKATEQEMRLIKRYPEKKKYASLFKHLELENKYIAILNKLPKAKKQTIEKEIGDIDNKLKDKYKFGQVKTFVETLFKDADDARKNYEKALKINPENTVALRGLGMIEYERGNIKQSLQYLKKLHKLSRLHIFQPYMYDIKLQKVLSRAYIKRGNIFGALHHVQLFIRYRLTNHKTLKKNYTL